MIHRRRFLTTAAGAALSCEIVPRCVLGGPRQNPPSARLNVAGIGVGGQGGGVVGAVAGVIMYVIMYYLITVYRRRHAKHWAAGKQAPAQAPPDKPGEPAAGRDDSGDKAP